MIELPIQDKKILNELNVFLDLLNKTNLDTGYISGKDSVKGYATDDEYLYKIKDRAEKYQLSKTYSFYQLKHYPEIDKQIIKFGSLFKNTKSGLAILYKPGDYFGWHHNSTSYDLFDILFTYSETGHGEFKYYKDNLIHTIRDKPGWSLKVGCFPAESKKEYLWHSVRSNSYRVSIARVTDNLDVFRDTVRNISGFNLSIL